MLFRLLLALLCCPAAAAASVAPPSGEAQNVLIIVADDLGVEQLASYGEGTDYPATPALDQLAQNGVIFRNAWTNPVCSPTRAAIHTGRYAFRTGVGISVKTHGLEESEITLPEMLDLGAPHSWAHAAIGKWHLTVPEEWTGDEPNLAGWGHFAGTIGSFVEPYDYSSWPKTVDGVETMVSTYATTDQVASALEWLDTAPEPWLLYLAFNTPHKPFHDPPSDLHTVDLAGTAPEDMARAQYRAMVEAMDTELGRLFASLGPAGFQRTHVFFLGDNGTPPDVVVPPVEPDKAKTTVFEGGVNVPFIVRSPLLQEAGGEVDGLVVATDLFATVAEIAGVDLAATLPPDHELDSVSLVPYLDGSAEGSLRSTVYTDSFSPAGHGVPSFFTRAIRNEQYKLISTQDDLHSLYDLWADPWENEDLLEGELTAEQQAEYESLFDEMYDLLGISPAFTEVYGCGVNPPGSMVVLSGTPELGSTVVFGIDNPLGTQAVGSLPSCFVSRAPLPTAPCGELLPGVGMTAPDAPGEVLINVDLVVDILAGHAWAGPGVPSPIEVDIPFDVSLFGLGLFLQGAMWDPAATFGIEFALTDAVEMRIGPKL